MDEISEYWYRKTFGEMNKSEKTASIVIFIFEIVLVFGVLHVMGL